MAIVLGKDEQVVREDSFTANLILFWLKANYSLTNKRVTGHSPNTFLGLIPLGKSEISQPLKTIASVSSSTEFWFKTLLIGIIFAIAGFYLLGTSVAVGLVLLIVGAVNILNCYTSSFVITNSAGESQWYYLSILEKSKVQNFVNEVNTVIADL